MNGGTSILLVEDMGIIAEAMKCALEKGGYCVTVASNGQDAMALLASVGGTFSSLITDVDLGIGPNGWDIARYAKAKNPKIEVIYLTGCSLEQWLADGVPNSQMVQKPITVALLLKAASTYFDHLAINIDSNSLD